MEAFVAFFEDIPTTYRTALLVGGFMVFWLLEGAVPLFRFRYRKWRHALPNFFFTLTTIIVNFALAFLLLQSSDWVRDNNFGIINWLPEMPLWAYVLLGVLLSRLLRS